MALYSEGRKLGPRCIERRQSRRRTTSCLWLLFVLITLAVAVRYFFNGERSLSSKARQLLITPIPSDPSVGSVYWLTPDRVLILDYDYRDLDHGQRQWAGTASMWSRKTGMRTRLEKLTAAMSKPNGEIILVQPSPDGTRIVWRRGRWEQYLPLKASCVKIDGSQSRDWELPRHNDLPDDYELVDWLDNTHYFELDRVLRVFIVRDVRDAHADRIVPYGSKEGARIMDIYWKGATIDVEPQIRDEHSPQMYTDLRPNEVRLLVYRVLNHELLSPKKTLVQSRLVRFPNGIHCREMYESPAADYLIFSCSEIRRDPLRSAIKRVFTWISDQPTEYASLWVSDVNGDNLNLLGAEPVKSGDGISDLAFVPHRKEISFRLHDKIFVLPVNLFTARKIQ
jgi:hypothetical protein